jgi:nitrate reductase gamma subunit
MFAVSSKYSLEELSHHAHAHANLEHVTFRSLHCCNGTFILCLRREISTHTKLLSVLPGHNIETDHEYDQ